MLLKNKNAIPFILILAIIDAYAAFPLTLGSLSIPAIPTMIAILLAIIFLSNSIFTNSNLQFVYLASFISVFGLFADSLSVSISERILALTQWVVALIFFVILAKLPILNQKLLLKFIVCFLIFLTLAGILEVLSPFLRGLSDIVRNAVYPSEYLYEADVRDIAMTGHIRPKVFTSEPSHYVKMIMFLSFFLYFLATHSWHKYFAFIALAISYLLTASPIYLLGYILIFFVYLRNLSTLRYTPLAVFFATLVLYLFIVAGSDTFLYQGIANRFSSFGQSDYITSENIRIFFPIITAVDVLVNYPFFGVGLGGESLVPNISSLNIDLRHALGNSALPKFVILFGLSSLALLLVLVRYLYLSTENGVLSIFFPFLLIFSFAMGGVESVRYWCYLGLAIYLIRCNLTKAVNE